MKLLDDVRLPIGLTPQWCDALAEELEIAERGLPELSPAALELAELAVSGEYDAEIVGSVLERDDKLREQVMRMANSAVYAAESYIESTAVAAQRIGMRALWEIAVIDVARLKVFGPVLGQVLGGARMWSIARLAGAISHRLSSAKLGRSRASILAGLILCVGPPLAHQLIRRVEDKTDELLPSRMRREVSNRIGPALGVALVRAWSLSASIESAAHAFADGRGELPIDREAQVAVFSVSMARYVTARGTDSLAIPLRWPTAVALGITEPELKGIVDTAANADANPLLP
ncbi:MAG: HDOD domain-containing protein [Planctomycetota bacterium]